VVSKSDIAASTRRRHITRDEGNSKEHLDLNIYRRKAGKRPQLDNLSKLSSQDQQVLLMSGIDPNEKSRSGSFFQENHSVIHCRSCFEEIGIMPSSEARRKFNDLKGYWWHALSVDKDIFTRRAEDHQEHGYFIRSKPRADVHYPLQACLYLTEDKLAQDIHNIIIAEEESNLNIITDCAAAPGVRSGLHVGISEFYEKKGAALSFTMIHNWAADLVVRPRSAVIVEEGGTFISNYIYLAPGRDIQMYPTAFLKGNNAIANFYSVLLSKRDSIIDVGSRVILHGEESKAEIISRAVSTGGKIIARGHLIGETPGIRAHLECNGLLLFEQGKIHAIPELEGKASNLKMSHEAAVGKIDLEKIIEKIDTDSI
jgi:Fe-S cluster assembly scaffold protein SufB